MTACQNSSYMVSSATENDHLVGKRNASRTPLRRPSQASTLMWPTGKFVPRIDRCGAVWSILEQEQQKQTGSRRLRKSVLLAKRYFTLPPALQPARHTHAPSVEECCRPELDWLSTSALTGSTKHDIIIIIEEVMVIIGNDGRTTWSYKNFIAMLATAGHSLLTTSIGHICGHSSLPTGNYHTCGHSSLTTCVGQTGAIDRSDGPKILAARDYFMAAMLDLPHLGPSGPTKFVFHRIPRIRKHVCRHKIRVSTMFFFRESMIIWFAWLIMGRIGLFFHFQASFLQCSKFSRLYTS